MKSINTCIVRTTFHDRAAMLKLSLEYQNKANLSDKYDTYIFVDPHPEHGFISDFDSVITNDYFRINWETNQNKYCWYNAIKYIFDNTNFEYTISIEDDIIISSDYFQICQQIIDDKILEKYSDILYFHIGAWIEPVGDPNKIVRSKASSRSILINRSKFNIVKNWVDSNSIVDNDHMMSDILNHNNFTTIAPKFNRHGHFGIYGWSSNGIHANMKGKDTIFENSINFNDLYSILKKSCLNKSELLKLNQNKNSQYFWNFDPKIQFTKLQYDI